MNKTFFVTGTDTEVGKTFISCALLEAANQQGLTTAAVKPVAAGAEQTENGLRNEDGLALHEAINSEMSYEQLNPVCLLPPIAPHIAAEEVGKHITVDRLAGFCKGVMMNRQDLTIIEGAGGWRVPLNPRETLADLAKELNTPVILVVGMRLGCLNHAMLTAEAIYRDGLQVAGWVANRCVADMSRYEKNLETLMRDMPGPCLGEVAHQPGAHRSDIAKQLNISHLLK